MQRFAFIGSLVAVWVSCSIGLAQSESSVLADPDLNPVAEPTQDGQSEVAQPTEPTKPFPVTFIASSFTRFEIRERFSGVGGADSDRLRFRARFGIQLDPVSIGRDLTLTLRFVPQASGEWEAGGDTLEDAELDLHEGFISFGNDRFMIDVGRMELVYGDHLVVGNVDWNPTGRSFDAIRARITPDNMQIDFFASLLTEGATPEVFDGDLYFLGTYAKLGKLINEKIELDAYLLAQLRHAASGNTAVNSLSRFTLGIRTKNRVGKLDYRFEAGLQTGKNAGATILAGQADLEVGVNFCDDKFRASLEGAFASGDKPGSSRDEAYNQLYPTAHKFLGLSDIIGARSNILTGILHLRTTAVERWVFYVDTHIFSRPQPDLNYAGTEMDFGALFKIGKGLKTRAGYSLFVPAEDLYGTRQAAHFTEFELRYDY